MSGCGIIFEVIWQKKSWSHPAGGDPHVLSYNPKQLWWQFCYSESCCPAFHFVWFSVLVPRTTFLSNFTDNSTIFFKLIVPRGESFHLAVPRLSVRMIPRARMAHSALIDLLNRWGVWGELQEGLFNKWQVFDFEYWNRQGMLLQMVQGTDFPLSRWDYCFLWRLLSFHRESLLHSFRLSGSWFLQGVSLWFLLRWWMVERAEAVLGDWLWGSWQEIKLYFCSMNQWRHLESSTSLLWAFGSVLVVLSAFSKSLWKHRGGMPVLVCGDCEELWPYAAAGAACASFWEHI